MSPGCGRTRCPGDRVPQTAGRTTQDVRTRLQGVAVRMACIYPPFRHPLQVAANKAAAARTSTADLNYRAERVRSRPDGAAKARGPSPRDRCSLGDGAGMLCAVLNARPCASLAPHHTTRSSDSYSSTIWTLPRKCGRGGMRPTHYLYGNSERK